MDVLGQILVPGLPVKCVKAMIGYRMAVLQQITAVGVVLEHMLHRVMMHQV